MVGRLVEQQQVGLEDQLPGDGKPLSPAAGERVDRLFEIGEANAVEEDLGGELFVFVAMAGAHRVEQHLQHVVAGRKLVLLGEVAEAEVSPAGELSGVGGFEPGKDLEQRGFSRSRWGRSGRCVPGRRS